MTPLAPRHSLQKHLNLEDLNGQLSEEVQISNDFSVMYTPLLCSLGPQEASFVLRFFQFRQIYLLDQEHLSEL